jgi:hypothetical protein
MVTWTGLDTPKPQRDYLYIKPISVGTGPLSGMHSFAPGNICKSRRISCGEASFCLWIASFRYPVALRVCILPFLPTLSHINAVLLVLTNHCPCQTVFGEA